uniref:Uncharacterized protein n=1 Tax=viral metagenome TaxID=1070528 RepID=A0A6M3KP72_9ZZZZ
MDNSWLITKDEAEAASKAFRDSIELARKLNDFENWPTKDFLQAIGHRQLTKVSEKLDELDIEKELNSYSEGEANGWVLCLKTIQHYLRANCTVE